MCVWHKRVYVYVCVHACVRVCAYLYACACVCVCALCNVRLYACVHAHVQVGACGCSCTLLTGSRSSDPPAMMHTVPPGCTRPSSMPEPPKIGEARGSRDTWAQHTRVQGSGSRHVGKGHTQHMTVQGSAHEYTTVHQM